MYLMIHVKKQICLDHLVGVYAFLKFVFCFFHFLLVLSPTVLCGEMDLRFAEFRSYLALCNFPSQLLASSSLVYESFSRWCNPVCQYVRVYK